MKIVHLVAKQLKRPGIARRILWVAVAVTAALSIWQMRARGNFQKASQQFTKIQADFESGMRPRMSLREAERLLIASGATPGNHEFVHVWHGPFSNYAVRLVVNQDGEVLRADSHYEGSRELHAPLVSPESNTVDVQALLRRGQIQNEVAKLISDAQPLAAVQTLPEAVEKVEQVASAESSTNPFIAISNSIVQSQYVNRRIDWYRRQWVNSYREHSLKHEEWAELAEAFLLQAANAVGRDGFAVLTQEQLKPMAEELLKLKCDDPLVLAIMLQIDSLDNPPDASDVNLAFLDSTYPPSVAYFAAYPFMKAADLLALQIYSTPKGQDPVHDVFAVEEPIEMRFINEHLVHRFRGSSSLQRQTDLQTVLATQQTPSAWLNFMLRANFCRRDDEIIACFLNAWHAFPENPEPPLALLKFAYAIGLNTGRVANLGKQPPEFWFRQAVRAQIDYPPAFPEYIRWSHWRSGGNQTYLMQFAEQCLNTDRFDTDVPLQYLKVVQHIQSIGFAGSKIPLTIRSRHILGTQANYKNFQRLVDGYTDKPEDASLLANYLVCIAYLSGNFSEALERLDALDTEYNPEVFDFCKVIPHEIRRSAASARVQRPFSLGRQERILQLAFSQQSTSLVCLAGDDRAYCFDAQSGSVNPDFSGEEGVVPYCVPNDGSNILAFQVPNRVTLRQCNDFRVTKELKLDANFKSMQPTGGRRGLWCTVHSIPDSKSLEINFRQLTDGQTVASLATNLSNIVGFDLAAQQPIVAAAGTGWPVGQEYAGESQAEREQLRFEVWNFESKTMVFAYSAFERAIAQLEISKDGELVAVSGEDRRDAVDMLAAPVSDYGVKIFDIANGSEKHILLHPAEVTCLEIIDEFNLLATGCVDGVVRLWDLDSGKLEAVCVGHTHGVSSLAYSDETNQIASGGLDGQINLWEVDAQPESPQLAFPLLAQPLYALDGFTIDPVNQDVIASCREIGDLRWHSSSNYTTYERVQVGQRTSTQDGRQLLLHAVKESEAQPVETTSFQVTDELSKLSSPTVQVQSDNWVTGMVLPDGKSLVTTGENAIIWNLRTAAPWRWGILKGHAGPVTSFSLSPNGKWLATQSLSPTAQVCVWELPQEPESPNATVRLVSQCATRISSDSYGISISPDGAILALQDSVSFVHIWDAVTGKQIDTLKGQSAKFSPDGKRLVLNGNNFDLLIYDVGNWQEPRRIPVHAGGLQNIQWAPTANAIWYSLNGWIMCIDAETGQDLLPSALL